MKKSIKILFMCGSLFLVMVMSPSVFKSANAELPPGSYERLKAHAQEKLKVKITEVHKEKKSERKLDVTFKAEVVEVLRSDFGLKPGSRITIHSYRWTGSYAGPKNPPLLSVGWVGMAYLDKLENSSKYADDNYTLAAYGDSFE
jgi:hypothetical protein